MNILVTTLGMSWQIIPELISFTNHLVYDYFTGNESVQLLREKHFISPVDECWVITIENQPDVGKILAWANHWHSIVKIAHCKNIRNFSTSEEIQRMRSFIYRVVLKASSLTTDSAGKLYLSLSGGRKTMSADMQEAGNLFGCNAMLHIIDCKKIPHEQKDDPLTEEPGKYAQYFMPVIINESVQPSFIISADETRIVSADYPFEFSPEAVSILFDEDGSLEKTIQDRKERSAICQTYKSPPIHNAGSSRLSHGGFQCPSPVRPRTPCPHRPCGDPSLSRGHTGFHRLRYSSCARSPPALQCSFQGHTCLPFFVPALLASPPADISQT
ncbi:MAG: hypothetical protein LBD79_09185 [Treponema sp.]|jgi:adenosine deaminase|nr:hypothetical protein [Treponema sp.]